MEVTDVIDDNTQNQEVPVQETQTTEAEPSLEDVYKSVSVEPSQPAQAQPAVQPQPPQVTPPPDPYDTEAHKAYLENIAKGQAALSQNVNAVNQWLTAQQQAAAKAKMETDLKNAVETVNAVVKHPNPKVIEAMLDAEARSDPRFKAVWDNRDKNPQAWAQAQKAIANKFAKEFDVQVDPALRKAQQIRKTSQSAAATTQAEDDSPNASWDGLSDEDFQRKWQQESTTGWN